MWLSDEQAYEIVGEHGSPVFVYSREHLRERARELMALELPYGLTVRYAMKANPHPEIIKLFADEGLHFDASSSYEAAELLEQGVLGAHISLASQQPAHSLPELLEAGVQYVATSMHQLQLFAAAAQSGARVALRINPPHGNGDNNRVTTGGANSSFGLWHEYLDDALRLAAGKGVVIDRLHVHIGSGTDPSAWGEAMDDALAIARRMPDVTTLDIGGGFKASRYEGEKEADMPAIAAMFAERLQAFATETGRQLRLEIEPGTWLVAHAAILLAEVVDIVDTGREGYTFLRLNTGLNDFIRPAMYGAQHRISVLNDTAEQAQYVVVGHCCESSDILTPAPNDPEAIAPRTLNKAAIGELVAIAGTGAYCNAFATTGYNAFPSAQKIFI